MRGNRLTGQSAGPVQDLTWSHDPNDNVTAITDGIDSDRSQNFTYDALDRLVSATGAYGTLSYSYDALGNRQTLTQGSSSETYSYAPDSNRLTQVVNGGTRDYSYDANGNTLDNTDRQFVYGENNRLQEARILGSALATYTYNGRGERVKKAAQTTTLHFYDSNGQLMAETDGSGSTWKAYIYLNGVPLAMVGELNAVPGIAQMFYIHTDHLGTPQKLTDSNQLVVWDAVYQPFGQVDLPTELVTYNQRFPGQYFDEETNLHYNYFRDYDPATGRYIESDPIGLNGGINTYTYVDNNPLAWFDSLGLAKICYRALDSWATPVVIGRPGSPADRDNNIIGHEHILFDDGSNIGFGPDGLFEEEGKEGEYSSCEEGLDDDRLKKAVENTPTGDYDFFFKDNNCQDWIERVRENYRTLQ